MVKKIFSAILIFGLMLTSNVAAAENPRTNKNFLLFYQHQGYEYFLKKDSLNWYNRDYLRVISFNYIAYDSINPARTDWNKIEKMELAYDVDERKVYFIGKNGELYFLNPKGTVAEGSGYAPCAEEIYYLVFGEKFYGTYDEDFYNSLED